MSRNVSSITRQALQGAQTEKVFLILITIDHPDLVSPLHLVNNNEDIISNGVTYQGMAFKFTPPVEEDGTIKNTKILIDNVDRQLVLAVRSITSAPTLVASIIRSDAPDVIEAGPWNFIVRNVSYNVMQVSGELVPDNPLRLYASQLSYRNIEFPGLYG